jgi:lambda repressor-like predicted transcriptional regulator
MTQPTKKVVPIKPLPADVLAILQEQIKGKSQAEIADELGISTSTVNKAIHDKFQGSLDTFCARVRGLWGGQSVECPVLGHINTKVCLDQQKQGGWSNPMRAALTRACKSCPNRQTTGGQHA